MACCNRKAKLMTCPVTDICLELWRMATFGSIVEAARIAVIRLYNFRKQEWWLL